MRVTGILYNFRLFLEGKQVKKSQIHQDKSSSKSLSKHFCWTSHEEKNISGSLYKVDIVDLPLLRRLAAICQKSRKQSFWEVIDVLVLLEQTSLAASRSLLQQLLACLNFTLEEQQLFAGANKNDDDDNEDELFLWYGWPTKVV